jgi:hypothetical protein
MHKVVPAQYLNVGVEATKFQVTRLTTSLGKCNIFFLKHFPDLFAQKVQHVFHSSLFSRESSGGLNAMNKIRTRNNHDSPKFVVQSEDDIRV